MNDVSIVIGATSGLGWNIARILFNAGDFVSAFGRRIDRLQGLRASICETKEHNQRLFTLRGDITNAEHLYELFSGTIKKYGHISRVVICSGQYTPTTSITPIDTWRKIMEVNFWGVINVISEVVNRIKNGDLKSKVTCITITSSLANHCVEGSGAYSCSKSALQKYVEFLSLDKEVSPSVLCVYAIQPPPFLSEMNHSAQISAEVVAKKIVDVFPDELKTWHGQIMDLESQQ